jgi:hypothetical protein
MRADARPAALLALASPYSVVLADARPATLLVPAFLAVVLADARPAALLPAFPFAVVLADARPPALLAPASLAPGCAGTLRSFSSHLRRLPLQPYYSPLFLHEAAFGPRCLSRKRDASCSPQPLLCLCLRSRCVCFHGIILRFSKQGGILVNSWSIVG